MENSFGAVCPKCRKYTPAQNGEYRCTHCGAMLSTVVFPAAFRAAAAAKSAEERLDNADGSCFFHPSKKAERICESCGRFLCSLCAIKDGERTLCPSCHSKGKQQGPRPEKIPRYDKIALGILLLSFLLTGGLTLPFGALVSLVICIVFYRKQTSLVCNSRLQLLMIALLDVLILVGTVALVAFIVMMLTK